MRRTEHNIGRRAACALLVSPFAALAAAAQERAVVPYMDRTKRQMLYEGPGGDEPEPEGLDEVRIGYFGPSDAAHAEGGSFWLGAVRAIEEENQGGGYRGRPFRLVPKWSDSPWTAGGRMVVEMAYNDRVWAIIGSIDGVATHVAEQVITKALLPLIDPGSTDRTVNAAMVPWMFSCLPGDPLIADALAPHLAVEAGDAGPVLVSSTGHDERHLAEEFKHWFATRRPGFSKVLDFQPGDANLETVVEQAFGARAVMVLGGVADTARAVRLLRARSKATSIYAGPAAARTAFRALAGAASEGVRCPQMTTATATEDGPDYAALECYDAARLVAAAIRAGGLNRIRICRALAGLSPWQGAAGEIRWSALNRNSRPVSAGIIRNARLEAFNRPV
jgi:ABC-type branched-subunit amino acid transport system substrate-binding protein